MSGMPSVGKTTVANEISKDFHLRHIGGGDMLKQIAIDRGYNPMGSDWWDSPEGMRFSSERKRNPNFDVEVDKLLLREIRKGGVVVTSYSVPWLARSGLKLWFAADQKTRARRLAGRDSISLKGALNIITRRDRENRVLYKKIYGIDFGKDLSVFNFVIDTEDLSAKSVAKAAYKIVSEYQESKEQSSSSNLRS